METIKVDENELRKKLIQLYLNYLKDDKRADAIEEARKIDGLWSGAFLLSKEIETAINNVRSMYTEPRLPKHNAKKILAKLLKKTE